MIDRKPHGVSPYFYLSRFTSSQLSRSLKIRQQNLHISIGRLIKSRQNNVINQLENIIIFRVVSKSISVKGEKDNILFYYIAFMTS